MAEKKLKGFSLIEILIVVALILILAAVTIVAINPPKHFADTRNAQRSSDLTQLLNAITQYTSEEGRTLASLGTITPCEDVDGNPDSTPIGTGVGNIDLSTSLVEEYIIAIPMDPSGGTEADTGYTICATEGGRVQLAAPSAENGKVIVVKR